MIVPNVRSFPPRPDHEGEPERQTGPATDLANAERLIDLHGNRFRYVGAWEAWLAWDGRRWERDEAGRIVEAAKDVGRRLLAEAITIAEEDERKRAVKWALQTQGATRIRAMIDLARTDPSIAVRPDDLDADRWALNTPSGIVDLRTGTLQPHDPARLHTKITAASYNHEATCATWLTFLERVLPDAEVREFVARAAGYALTGDISEHKFFVAYGTGANGKTTLLEAVSHALGDYAGQAEADLLLARKDAHPTGIADLRGQRLVIASESDQGRRLAEGTVKRLTGGDRIKARRMGQDFFEFSPSHKMWLLTNHRPDVRGSDAGMWRRIRLVPFEITIADEEQDKQLPAKLLAEADGILSWAVAGCLRWQRGGLTEPLAVSLATAAYRAEQDAVADFLGDRCELEGDASTSAADLYDAYSKWCADNGEQPVTQRSLGQALTERGLDRVKQGKANRWHWIGLRLQYMEANP